MEIGSVIPVLQMEKQRHREGLGGAKERGEEDGGWRGRTFVHWGLVCTRHKLGASHTSTVPRRQSNMSHFTDRETEAQRGGAPSLRSHSLGLLNWVWNLGCLKIGRAHV